MTNHCTFKQSIALKEIGFDESVRDVYNKNGFIQHGLHNMNYNQGESTRISAPTRSEVLQWAREKHGIDAWIMPASVNDNKRYIYVISTLAVGKGQGGFTTYPEAEDALVDKIIEILTPSAE